MRKICRTILAAGLMACMMMPAVNVMATDDIVGNWQADEAGVRRRIRKDICKPCRAGRALHQH